MGITSPSPPPPANNSALLKLEQFLLCRVMSIGTEPLRQNLSVPGLKETDMPGGTSSRGLKVTGAEPLRRTRP